MSSLPSLTFALWPLLQLKGLESGREKSAEGEQESCLLFLLQKICFSLLAPFSTSPEPRAFLAQTLPLWFVRTAWHSLLTLTVSSDREVEAASFPRATESGYCPRWNSVEIKAHSKVMGGGVRHGLPPQPPVPTCCNPKLPSSLRLGRP